MDCGWTGWRRARACRETFFHDNLAEDLFVEVNHGPFLVDNNFFMSGTSLLDVSEGGAYAHNFFGGRLVEQSGAPGG